MNITILEGKDIGYLLRDLGVTQEVSTVYRLRISQSSDGTVKWKVNEGTWTPPTGKPDA